MDHDYEVGFCIWLTEDDYKKIGKELQDAYDQLCHRDQRLKYRRGVFSINEFYQKLLDINDDFENHCSIKLESIPEHLLAAATNGQIYTDPLGKFTEIREQLLAYYPEELWRKKLAGSIHEFSQYAQSNYSRMMARQDSITSLLCIGKATESVLDLLYLLEKHYAPYYKWKRKGREIILAICSAAFIFYFIKLIPFF